MEQHPIPQDITGFKFKLVGDMTLQQFGYLAGGAVLAYLSFVFKFPFLIKWPLVFFFGLGGVALAFLPVEERPLDRWLIAFIKAIYAPTQYYWQKKGKLPAFFETNYFSSDNSQAPIIVAYNGDRAKLESYLKNLPRNTSSTLDIAEQSYLSNLDLLFSGKTPNLLKTATNVPPSNDKTTAPSYQQPAGREFTIIAGQIFKGKGQGETAAKPEEKKTDPSKKIPVNDLGKIQQRHEILAKEASGLRSEMENLQKSQVFTINDLNKLKELAQRLTEIETQRNKAVEESRLLRQQLAQEQKEKVKPMTEKFQAPQNPRVKFVTNQSTKSSGLPNAPQTPNIISGLIIDKKGEILPGVIVVVKDNQDNPVRAIKTNKLGQFSISTPLPNGIYALELEKEGYEFDIIEIEAKGELIPAMEIKTK